MVGVHEEAEEDFVAFPEVEVEEALFVDPCQLSLVAVGLSAGPFGGSEEVHVFAGPYVADKGHNAAVLPSKNL